MRCTDPYTKVVLTVIAALLGWNILTHLRVATVHAQSTKQYGVEKISTDWTSKEFLGDFEIAINNIAKGRELVTVLPFDQKGSYLAIYKERPLK